MKITRGNITIAALSVALAISVSLNLWPQPWERVCAWFYGLNWPLFLEFVKVLLSWPALASVVAVCFIRRFGKEIGIFLSNGRLKPPGYEAVVLQTPDPNPPPSPEPEPEPPLVAEELAEPTPEEPKKALPTAVEPPPPPPPQDPPKDDGRNSALAHALVERRRKEDQFRYLNALLVMDTQHLLDQLAYRGPMTVVQFNEQFIQRPAVNRQAMLTILYQHGLISVEAGMMKITEQGLEYARWQERQDWITAQRTTWAATSTNPLLIPPTYLDPPPGNIFNNPLSNKQF